MSHQPFETWIFSEESLNDDQQSALKAHLSECEQCSAHYSAMLEIKEAITKTTNPAPEPGFAQRWHYAYAADQLKQQQLKIWWLTLALLLLANLIFLSLILFNLTNTNWSYEISRFFANFSLVTNRTNQLWTAVKSITRATPGLIPAFSIVSITSLLGISALIVIGFRSLIQRSNPQQEGVTLK
jgi:predicted anti-sigma-YlaC factor YlaD